LRRCEWGEGSRFAGPSPLQRPPVLPVDCWTRFRVRACAGRGNPEGPAGGEAAERRTANHPEDRAARHGTRSRGRQLGGTHGPGGGCNGWSVRATGGPRRAHCRSASRQDRATGDHRGSVTYVPKTQSSWIKVSNDPQEQEITKRRFLLPLYGYHIPSFSLPLLTGKQWAILGSLAALKGTKPFKSSPPAFRRVTKTLAGGRRITIRSH
jgi:hypothetical protein